MLTVWTAILFTFPYVVAVKSGATVIYAIWVCLLFLCLSGVFVLMPAATGRIFGPIYMAVNYGMVFSAFVSSLPTINSPCRDSTTINDATVFLMDSGVSSRALIQRPNRRQLRFRTCTSMICDGVNCPIIVWLD